MTDDWLLTDGWLIDLTFEPEGWRLCNGETDIQTQTPWAPVGDLMSLTYLICFSMISAL